MEKHIHIIIIVIIIIIIIIIEPVLYRQLLFYLFEDEYMYCICTHRHTHTHIYIYTHIAVLLNSLCHICFPKRVWIWGIAPNAVTLMAWSGQLDISQGTTGLLGVRKRRGSWIVWTWFRLRTTTFGNSGAFRSPTWQFGSEPVSFSPAIHSERAIACGDNLGKLSAEHQSNTGYRYDP